VTEKLVHKVVSFGA